MRSIRIPRRAVLALATLIVMAPGAIVLADSYRRDSQDRVIHHHTSAYSVYYGFTGDWRDQGENSRVEWNADLGRLAQGAQMSLPRVDTPSDSVGATNEPEIDVEKQNFGDTGNYIVWGSPWHDASSPVTINTYYSSSSDDKRGRMCRVFGNILGIAGVSSGRNDCMQSPTTWKNVSDDSVQLVNDFYGPNVSIQSPLTSRKDDVKTTGVYDVSATADGHATKSITIRLDGNVIASKTQTPCAGKCSVSPDAPATIQNLSAGTHTLSATARNEFDQTTTKTITLTVAAPTPDWGFNEDWDRLNPDVLGQIARSGNQGAATNMGATSNRLIVRWNAVEPNAPVGGVHDYQWGHNGHPVQAYNAMRDAGQKPVLVLYAAPDWARVPGWETCPSSIYGDGCAYPPAPSHDDDWQAFVRAAVNQFPTVLAIEIWNEPNLQTYWYYPEPGAARYDQVLAAGCQGAKQGAQDRGIALPPVIVGGLAPGPAQAGPDPPLRRQQNPFLTNIYAAEDGKPQCADTGPSPDFKGIGDHVYPDGGADQGAWVSKQTAALNEIRDARSDAQDGPARIWITEVGVTTAPGLPSDQRRSESQQGPTLAAMYEKAREQSDVKSFLVHRYRDLTTDNDHDKWSFMGVVRSGDTFPSKPAFSYLRCELGGRNC